MVYAAAADGRTDGRTPEDAYYKLTWHYANIPMQYTAIFHGCKMTIFS